MQASILKAEVLNAINYFSNLSISDNRIVVGDYWVCEDGSQRRYDFKAYNTGEVEISFRDLLIIKTNSDCSLLTTKVSENDQSLLFLINNLSDMPVSI